MISIVVASDDALTRQLLVVIAAAALVLAVVLAHGGRGGRFVAGALALTGFLVVLGLTLSPDRFSGPAGHGCAIESSTPLDDIPNVALFFVPTLFAVVATRRPLLLLLAAPALSAAIEVAQDVLSSLGRRCDLNDVLANSTGAVAAVVLGSLILLMAGAWKRERPTGSGSHGPRPTVGQEEPERQFHRVY